ncbi:hypothetical protein EON83_22755 [bacterium]|nr:MAG: hypothetical protein EON83_22755 [bacterium]
MNSLHSPKFKSLSAFAVLSYVAGPLLVPQVQAAEPTSPKIVPPTVLGKNPRNAETPPSPQDALNFLKLDKVRQLCAQTIALKVENASADAVVAQVRRVLSTGKTPSKIPIEVRRVKPINLTFNSKNSTVAKVLTSTARLGAAQLWIFGDHLLLAPAEALTPAEKESQNKGFAIEGSSSELLAQSQKRLAYSSFIANELKDLKPDADDLKGRETRGARSIGPLLANTTFSQLSPDAQAMLQELLNLTANGLSSSHLPGTSNLSFSANTPVEIIGATTGNGPSNQLEIVLAGSNKSEWTFSWGLDGTSTSIRGTTPGPTRPTQPSPPKGGLPLDLSADKS